MIPFSPRDTFGRMSAPTFSITTYGCQMNKNDSERIASLLSSLGFSATEQESTADVIIVNTCSVRQSAEDRVFGSQEKYLTYKKTKPNMIVAVTGCMAGRDQAAAFRKRLPATDLYFPTPDMVHLPRWIAELRPDLVNSADFTQDYLKIRPMRDPRAQAYVTIQTGCNKFCTYCVVPHARGLERNRPARDVIEECREAVAHGVIEITLLGQTVNSFIASDPETFSVANPFRPTKPLQPVKGENHFAALLWELNGIEGLDRLHWTAAHPMSMTDDVIAALTLPKQLCYMHLPVQSGSDEVLKRMNRKYTRAFYLEKVRKIRAARPDIALGTDIIVGFSGETRAQFDETVSLYHEVGFDIAYLAQYSPRSGTLGVKLFSDDVPAEEKRERWDILQAIMEETTSAKNAAFLGRQTSVLVDRIERGMALGNSREMKMVRFPSQEKSVLGRSIPVRITKAGTWILEGERVAP